MPQTQGFKGLHIVSFENRRADAMAKLITKEGGIPQIVPAMREIPLEQNQEAIKFGEQLLSGKIDLLILMTGVGTRLLIEVLKTKYSLDQIKSFLSKIKMLSRGPKPSAALAEFGLRPHLNVPEPNTWHEILSVLDKEFPVNGKKVAVQEYGAVNERLRKELKQRGADVTSVPVYRWELPSDTQPIKQTINDVIAKKIHAILWTNAQQAVNVCEIARKDGKEKLFLEGCKTVFVCSIGPTCSETLNQLHFPIHFEPTHPKMGNLVSEAAQKIGDFLKKG